MPAEAPSALARAATSLASAAALYPLAYQCVRAVTHVRAPEPDPRAILWSARSALLEAMGVAGYVVAALALLAWPALGARAARPRLFEACVAAGLAAGVVGGALR